MANLALGVDLGGTKIAAGVFDESGKLHGDLTVRPTRADGPADRTMASLEEAAGEALSSAGVAAPRLAGIGVGTTGPLDPRAGTLLEAEMLPRMYYYPLGPELEKRYGAEVTLTNDANCFALAEAHFGAGRGEDIVVGVTLGTGCGCGIVIGGRLLEGTTCNAGELYRNLVADRTFDEALSGPGLERLYREKTGRRRSGGEINALATEGDAVAAAVFHEFGWWVGRGLGVVGAVLDPGVVVLGGAVATSFRFFEEAMNGELEKHLAPSAAARMRVVPSTQGPQAGALGAAALVLSGGRLA